MHIDNVGYIFLLDNTLVYQQANHIDVRHHSICDYVKDITVKLQFVRSEENCAGPFTKILSTGPFEFGSFLSWYVHCE